MTGFESVFWEGSTGRNTERLFRGLFFVVQHPVQKTILGRFGEIAKYEGYISVNRKTSETLGEKAVAEAYNQVKIKEERKRTMYTIIK